ncbi:MAG: tRNA (guanosine(46)-N7)-methyltransferase TrmB [Flavobacteriaceae bacterium]|tara:strand:- start:5197 stop:5871 length:675 start_codon:yes stop_codon:yes gene_type:complete
MGSKNKLKKFQENNSFKNVIQPNIKEVIRKNHLLRGNWRKVFFKNNNPIYLELGCGKGEYSTFLAKKYPDKNFVGIDIKGARFWHGAKLSQENNLENICFLRIKIEHLEKFFADSEIEEIWITFPDPQFKFNRTKHRLTNSKFLKIYNSILKPNGLVHLKTDSDFMFGYSLGIIEGKDLKIKYAHHDVYNNKSSPEISRQVQTYYEKMFLKESKKIKFLSFTFR